LPAAPATASPKTAQTFGAALQPYLQVQALLAQDKSDGAAELLHQVAAKLEPLSKNSQAADAYRKITEAANASTGKNLDELRKGPFRDVSAVLIEIGKVVGVPADAKPVQVFHCP